MVIAVEVLNYSAVVIVKDIHVIVGSVLLWNTSVHPALNIFTILM